MKTSKLTMISVIVLICSLLITTYIRINTRNQDKNITVDSIIFPEYLETLPIEDAFGPESLTFDPAGDGPYAGVSDGRIVKWVPHQRRWVDFAFTSPLRELCGKKQSNHEEVEHKCGRPLGLRFNEKTGELYIADAYLGLMTVGPKGGLASRVVTEVEGVPLGFTNGLDIDQQTGVVYFTSSSTLYPRRKYMSVILSKDKTGRLLKYNPETKQATKVLDNLSFPNGVSLTKDGKSLLVVETTTCRILRYWLGNNNTTTEELVQVPGYPDNINRNSNGDEYWVGVYSKRGNLLKWLLSYPWVGTTIVNLPFNIGVELAKLFVRMRAIGVAVKVDENGNVLQVIQETSGYLKFVSEVVEKDGHLWFGSVILPFATFYKRN